MAAQKQKTPPPPFHVQATLDNPQTFSHHQSVSKLWAERWRPHAVKGTYPFGCGKVEDFDPIFESLKAASNDDVSILFDPDAYASHFLPVGELLVQRAEEAQANCNNDLALELFLRASSVYRMARFPINRSPLTNKAWQLGRQAFEAAGQLLDPILVSITIPFKHASHEKGDRSSAIHAYLRLPDTERPASGAPVFIMIGGLDSYRCDHLLRQGPHLKQGFAVINLDMPGTADSPCAGGDPTAPDRAFDSVFDWISGTGGKQFGFDPKKVIVYGSSTGGYNAIRVAHTHADKLFAAISHGGACHYMFDERWIRAQNHGEYPFALADALAWRFGYKSVEEYIADEPQKKFSLELTGILAKRSCKLFLVNGTEDSVFPIEDLVLVASRGRAKAMRLVEGAKHMAEPYGDGLVNEWIDELMSGEAA